MEGRAGSGGVWRLVYGGHSGDHEEIYHKQRPVEASLLHSPDKTPPTTSKVVSEKKSTADGDWSTIPDR